MTELYTAARNAGVVKPVALVAEAHDPDKPWLVYGAGCIIDAEQVSPETMAYWRSTGRVALPIGEVEVGVAHMASDQPMPELDTAAEWDVIEDLPTFSVGSWATIDGLGLVEIVGVNQSSEGRLTIINHGTEGNQPPGTVAYAGTSITATVPPS